MRLIQDRTHAHLAAIGGVGCGKTTFGFAWHHDRCLINHKCPYSLFVSETGKYSKIAFQSYIEFLEACGWQEKKHFRANRSAPYSIRYYFGHTVLFWSAETKIVAVSTSHDTRDEEDLFDPTRIREIDSRRRHPNADLRQSLSLGHPEGLKHLFEFFGGPEMVRNGRFAESDRKLVLHSSSYDNPFLPEDYFRTLEENFGWDEAYFNNYVMGDWTNLSRDAFYFAFTNENITPLPIIPDVPRIYWTLDNNVGKMQWAAVQDVAGVYRVFKSNAGTARNIQESCEEFEKLFPPAIYKDWEINVAGDAKLWDRSNQTYTTGYQLIEAILKPKYSRLQIVAYRGNPLVNERSMTSNKLLKTQRLMIDPSCKRVIHSARSTQSDGKGGIVKPSKDVVTHGMECVDHLLCLLEPVKARSEGVRVAW